MIGMFEPVCAPWSVGGVPDDFSFGELAPDWDRMTGYLETAMQRVPELAGRQLTLTALSGGITNRNFLVEVAGETERYVIRLAGNDTHLLGISRELVDTQFGSYSYREAIGSGHAYGIELIARCDKAVEVQTAYVVPTREQVEEELFNQQISALAQRYMRDLKRDADVEAR